MAEDFRLLVGTKIDGTKLQSQLNAIPESQRTVTVSVKGDTKQVSTLYKDGNATYQTLQKLNTEGQTVSTTFTKMSTSVGKSADTLITKIGDIGKKVVAFGAVTSAIALFSKGMSEAVSAVKELDDAQTDMKKVSDLNGEALDNYTEKLGELGDAVYRSKTEMLEASVIFKQGGFSEEESAQLSQIANLYENIADKEVSAADSASFLISQIKAFNIPAENAITILDQVNQVSNEYASSTTDLSTALTKNASVFATYGNDMNEALGLVTSAVEVMPNQASRVSNGLRTIAIEIGNLQSKSKTLEVSVGGVTKEIDLFNESGESLGTFDVLNEINENWDKMTDKEKQSIATMIGHKTQASVFLATMNNFNTAIDASTTALDSQGSAWEENDKRAESLTA
ncbi:MAG: phage tail tape measure protein [Thermoplasmata archaeon M9B1D]|nr:MAG: phage tail tape measure protein [Thermoplasmata archaeon M9B1D]